MAAVTYTKADWTAEADIKPLPGGVFQGIVQVVHRNGSEPDASQHLVEGASDSPEEALEEAKALAHRILASV